jgi:hypothetical protein
MAVFRELRGAERFVKMWRHAVVVRRRSASPLVTGRGVEVACFGRCVVGAWGGLRELIGMMEIGLESGLKIAKSGEMRRDKGGYLHEDDEGE